jgi:hypothetical protein
MSGDASTLSCAYCGLVDRNPTPPVEAIDNLCRNPQCLHPIQPEHDAIGCHVDGCLCTDQREAVVRAEDVLPNAQENKNSKYSVGQRVSLFYSGNKSIAGSGVIKKVMPVDQGYEQEYDLDVDKTTHSMGVSKGLRRVAESDITNEVRNATESEVSKDYTAVTDLEKKNSDPSESQWKDRSDYADDGGCKKCKWGAPGSGHSSGYHKKDCAVLKKERDAYDHFQGAERRNASRADFQKWREAYAAIKDKMGPLTSRLRALEHGDQKNTPEYQQVDKALAALEAEETRMLATRPVEMDNAIRPAQEAFEAHVANCANCGAEYSNAQPDPAKLCEEGRGLLTAGENENAGEDRLGKEYNFDNANDALAKVKELEASGKRSKYADRGGHITVTEIVENANATVEAKGGEEAGKPGGTVTVVNAGDDLKVGDAIKSQYGTAKVEKVLGRGASGKMSYEIRTDKNEVYRVFAEQLSNAISREQAVGILKWVAGESLKPISVNMETGETVTIEELERIAGTGQRPEHRNTVDPNDTKCDGCNAYGVVTRPTSACGDAVKNLCRSCWEAVKEIGAWPAEDAEPEIVAAGSLPEAAAGARITILVNNLRHHTHAAESVPASEAAAAGAAFWGRS